MPSLQRLGCSGPAVAPLPQPAAPVQSGMSAQSFRPSPSLSMPSPQAVSSCSPPWQPQPLPQTWFSQSGSAQSTLPSPSLSTPSPQADSPFTPASVQAQPVPQASPRQLTMSGQSRLPLLS